MIELRGGIYARRSKDLSTEAQVERVRAYMAAIERRLSEEYHQPVRVIVAPGCVFRDEGQSGLTFERSDYARLRAAIARRELDVLAVYATDRMGRPDDPTDMLLERRACIQAGVRVFAEVGDYEVTGADEMTVIRFFLESVFAGRELRTTRRRTREGQQAAWQHDNRRYAFGGDVRYGLRLDEHKHLAEHPDQARVLREMVRWVLEEGLNGAEVADRLNLRNVPAPTGRHWWPRTVHRILHDPALAGAGVTVTAAGQRYNIPSPALVEPAEFQALQRVLAAQSRPRGRVPDVYPLSGLMLCQACGRPFTGFGSKGYAWYRCQGRAKHRQLGIQPCGMPILPVAGVEGPVWGQVAGVLANPALLQAALADDPAEIERLEAEDRAWRSQLARKQQAQVRLVTEWSGSMHPWAVKAAQAELTREIEEIETHLMELDLRLLILRKQAQPRDYAGVDLGRLPATGRAALVREVIHSISVEQLGERRVSVRVRYYPVSPAGQGLTAVPGWAAQVVEPMQPIVLDL